MKKIILTSICAFGLVGTAWAETAPTSELPIKVFAGANVAMTMPMWSNDLNDIMDQINTELPGLNLGLGAEAGIKFGATDKIYNFGLSIAYDYMFDSAANIGYPYNQLVSEISTGFSAIGIYFDNYIRFADNAGKRSDLVLGIGYTNGTERIQITTTQLGYTYELSTIDSDDSGSLVGLKIGYLQQITSNLDFSAMLRIFIPTVSEGDLDSIFNVSAGIRYNF